MKPMRRLFRSRAVQSALSWLAALYLRLLHATTRWTAVRPPATQDLLDRQRPFIACFWHGRMIVMHGGLPRHRKVHILVSEHRDGVLISRAAARLGVATVAGSSKRGGVAALRAIERALAAGGIVGITPDGPRGPRMRAKAGAIKAAQISGMPVVPISGAVSRCRILRTWDRFCLSLPFARGAIYWGEPIEIPRAADPAAQERARDLLERRLNDLTARADRHFGRSAVEPAARGADHGARQGGPGRARA
ncbi:MAG: lysophospholipid acyltransferase family protein [Kiloniellaceae bacterium]